MNQLKMVPSRDLTRGLEPEICPLDYTAGAGRPYAERQARDMLDAFASVGVGSFDYFYLPLGSREQEGYTWDVSSQTLSGIVPSLLLTSQEHQKSLIIRPRPAGCVVQLDDLDLAKVEQVRPISFLVICTSPDNYQAWVAVSDGDKELMGRLKRGLGTDKSASGATRMSGSLNFKPRYAPDFPRIQNVHISPGLVVKGVDLEALGLLAPQERLSGPHSPRPGRSKNVKETLDTPSNGRLVVRPMYADRVSRMARAYMKKVDPAIDGEGGDKQTYAAIRTLENDFALPLEWAWPILLEWNARCVPPWDEEELLEKYIRVTDTYEALGPRGAKIQEDHIQYALITEEEYYTRLALFIQWLLSFVLFRALIAPAGLCSL